MPHIGLGGTHSGGASSEELDGAAAAAAPMHHPELLSGKLLRNLSLSPAASSEEAASSSDEAATMLVSGDSSAPESPAAGAAAAASVAAADADDDADGAAVAAAAAAAATAAALAGPGAADVCDPRATRHGLSLRGFHPAIAAALPSPAAFAASPHYPLVVTQNPFAVAQNVRLDGHSDPAVNLPLVNAAGGMAIDSALGAGTLEVHIRGLRSSRPERFAKKRRSVHVAVQVRFRRPVVAADLCMGQEVSSECAVPLWLSETLLTLAARTFSATTRVSVRTSPRYFMNPVLAACQLINVSREGEQPGLWDAREDVTLMLPGAVDAHGRPLSADARRKWCDVPANIAGARFVPGLVYTFHCWQHHVDFGGYRLNLGPLNLDLAPILHRSPVQFTCRDVGTGEYAFSVLAWHERALYGCAGGADGGAAAAAAAAADEAAEKLGGGGGLGARLRTGVGRLLVRGRGSGAGAADADA